MQLDYITSEGCFSQHIRRSILLGGWNRNPDRIREPGLGPEEEKK